MIRMFIEDKELDVSKNFTQQITYAIDDLRNLDSKSTSFTKTIILPGTTRNNALLGNIFQFNNANFTNDQLPNVNYNFNAARSSKCRIESDGLKMIKGSFRLLEIIVDGSNIEYECSVIGELGGLAMKLGASRIDELDFSAHNHTYSLANITASWDNANAGTGYYYPLIDYGVYGVHGNKHDWKVGTFRPALFVKQYIDKIFQSAGYTYECDLFTTSRFKSLIIPHNQKLLTMIGDRVAYCTPVNTNFNVYQRPVNTAISMENFSGTDWVLNAGANIKYTGTNPTTVNLTAKITGVYLQDTDAGAEGLKASILRWSPTDLSGTIIQEFDIPGGTTNSPFEVNFSINNISMPQDYFFQVVINSEFWDGATVSITGSHVTVKSLSPQLINVNLGDTLLINDTLPKNILQKDFFVSILKLFNLFVDEDNFNDRHVVIKPYPDYYTGVVEDWSNKVNRGKPIRVKPMSELNARYFDFKYASDSDYWNDLYKKRYNEGYGSRRFDSGYEFGKETQSLELIFAPTPLVGYTGEDKVYSTILKQTGTAPSTSEENVDSVIRILQAKKVTGVSSWDIINPDATAIIGTYTDYPYAGHLDDPDSPNNDLNFGAPQELFFTLVSGNLTVNQFNVYYSGYMAEITDKDSKLLSCELKLNDVDIFNLDFATYKHIDGGLYRLQRLIDYTPQSNDPVKAELLKVIYTTY